MSLHTPLANGSIDAAHPAPCLPKNGIKDRAGLARLPGSGDEKSLPSSHRR